MGDPEGTGERRPLRHHRRRGQRAGHSAQDLGCGAARDGVPAQERVRGGVGEDTGRRRPRQTALGPAADDVVHPHAVHDVARADGRLEGREEQVCYPRVWELPCVGLSLQDVADEFQPCCVTRGDARHAAERNPRAPDREGRRATVSTFPGASTSGPGGRCGAAVACREYAQLRTVSAPGREQRSDVNSVAPSHLERVRPGGVMSVRVVHLRVRTTSANEGGQVGQTPPSRITWSGG